jgi:nicotinamide mononucleotide (NMN) deamidase PncC
VGTVWLGVDAGGSVSARRVAVPGDRDEIRRRAAQAALDLVRRALSDGPTPATVDAFDGLALPR